MCPVPPQSPPPCPCLQRPGGGGAYGAIEGSHWLCRGADGTGAACVPLCLLLTLLSQSSPRFSFCLTSVRYFFEEHTGLFIAPVCVHLGCGRNVLHVPPAALLRGLQFAHKSGSHQLGTCRSLSLRLAGVAVLSSDLRKPLEWPCLGSEGGVLPSPFSACRVFCSEISGCCQVFPEDDPNPVALQI